MVGDDDGEELGLELVMEGASLGLDDGIADGPIL